MNISTFSRELPVLEDKIDDRVFVVTAERLDEAVDARPPVAGGASCPREAGRTYGRCGRDR